MQTFTKNGMLFNSIERDFDESYEVYLERAWLIINTFCKNKENNNINEIIKLSKIWRNIKYLNCSYTEHIIKAVHNKFGDKFGE